MGQAKNYEPKTSPILNEQHLKVYMFYGCSCVN